MAMRRRSRTTSGSAASVISAIGGLFAVVIVLYILMVVLGANPANPFVAFVSRSAEGLALFFPSLFDLGNTILTTIVNYGLAAVFWVAITGFLARLLARY